MLKTLDSIKAKLHSKTNEAEKLKQRKLATEATFSVLREGQMLASKTKCKKTMDTLKAIKDKHNAILVLTEFIPFSVSTKNHQR